MPPGLGLKSSLQIGVEATYAAATTAATAHIEIISANLDPDLGSIPDPSLYDGVSRRGFFQGGQKVTGRILIRSNYGGGGNGCLGRLIRAAMGDPVATSGSAPSIIHTYKESATPKSLSLELIEGDIPTGKCKLVKGCIVTDMVIRGTAGQGEDAMLQFEFGIAGKSITTNATPTSSPALLPYPPVSPMLFHQSGIVTDDGSGDTQANQRVRSFELTYTNNYDLDRFYFGSLTPDQPLRNDFVSCRWRFTSEFADINALNRANTWTPAAPAGTTPKVKVVSGTDSFEIRSENARIVEYGNPIEGYGALVMNITHEAWRGANDLSALVAVLTNGNTGVQEDGAP